MKKILKKRIGLLACILMPVMGAASESLELQQSESVQNETVQHVGEENSQSFYFDLTTFRTFACLYLAAFADCIKKDSTEATKSLISTKNGQTLISRALTPLFHISNRSVLFLKEREATGATGLPILNTEKDEFITKKESYRIIEQQIGHIKDTDTQQTLFCLLNFIKYPALVTNYIEIKGSHCFDSIVKHVTKDLDSNDNSLESKKDELLCYIGYLNNNQEDLKNKFYQQPIKDQVSYPNFLEAFCQNTFSDFRQEIHDIQSLDRLIESMNNTSAPL